MSLFFQRGWLSAGLFFLSFVVCVSLQNGILASGPTQASKHNNVWLDLVKSADSFPSVAHLITAGSLGVMADLFWIQALQSDDIECPKDLQRAGCRSPFTTLANLALKFDPRDALVARVGILVADIVVKDLEGGSEILKNGLERNDSDQQLHYRAGYHYMFEVVDTPQAARHFYRAAELGAPRWLYSLAARLDSESGRYEFVRKYLVDEIAANPDARYTERLRGRLAEIEARHQEQSRQPAANRSSK